MGEVAFSHLERRLRAIFCMTEGEALMAAGVKAESTNFLSKEWYSPWWKMSASGPIIFILLAGYVGLKTLALLTSTIFAASGLEIITQRHPNT